MSSAVEEPVLREVAAKRLCVLKFGSSVLSSESHLPRAVAEIARTLQGGRTVVAVVSAPVAARAR